MLILYSIYVFAQCLRECKCCPPKGSPLRGAPPAGGEGWLPASCRHRAATRGASGTPPPTNIPGTAVVRRLPAGWGHPALRAAYKTLRRRDFRRVPLYIQKRQPPSQGLALISNIQSVFYSGFLSPQCKRARTARMFSGRASGGRSPMPSVVPRSLAVS